MVSRLIAYTMQIHQSVALSSQNYKENMLQIKQITCSNNEFQFDHCDLANNLLIFDRLFSLHSPLILCSFMSPRKIQVHKF